MSDLLKNTDAEEVKLVLQRAQEQSNADWKPAKRGDPFATCVDRRAFLRGGAALIGGMTLATTMHGLLTRKALAGNVASPYGDLYPIPDESTGLPLIKLPLGFRYMSYGWRGDPMDNGVATPGSHDGMAVVRELGRFVLLTRNHELNAGTPFGQFPYSPEGAGGTTNIVFDTLKQRFTSNYPSLCGTLRNCAGGLTPWGTWLTCEEVGTTTTSVGGTIPHGYVFESGVLETATPVPLKEMGRFAHEAAAVDPTSGIVYQTEDGASVDTDAGSGFYRFIPRIPRILRAGGTLQMMKIAGQPQFDTRPLSVAGTSLPVEWVDVPIPDPDVTAGESSTFQQGYDAGGALFSRLEGCWYGDGKIFFLSTDGGPITDSGVGEGQVYVYDPAAETVQLIFASPDRATLENPDNLAVAPDGSLILCEDNAGATTNPGERLLFLNLNGQLFDFALNNLNFTAAGLGQYVRPESGAVFSSDFRQNEWAGATFSADGKWLFVNIQGPGITFAITGPWLWL